MPCFNEALNLQEFYSQALTQINKIKLENQNLNYEFIFIDDGSKDNTLSILKQLQKNDKQAKFISFSRNFGKESAILAGLKLAKGSSVILIDADLQHPIDFIYKMYQHKDKADIIYARRQTRKGDGDSFIRSAFSDLFYKISNLLSSVKLDSGVSDFRLMSRKVVDSILELNEYHRFSKGIFAWVGFSSYCLEYRVNPRIAGSSSWSFKKLFSYGILGIISFSTMPLRVAFILGFIASTISLIYGGIIIIDTLYFGASVKGFASLMCAVIFFSGVTLLILGIIGEYIAKIYEQVKNRPHYIIKETSED